MNDFHKKILEKRVKQDNIKWLTKEFVIGVIGAFIVYFLITSK